MNANKKHIELLWNKFIQNEASQKELDELIRYVESASAKGGQFPEDELFSFIDRQLLLRRPVTLMEADTKAAILQEALRSGVAQRPEEMPRSGETPSPERRLRRIPFYRRWQYAAVLLLILATGAYFWFQQSRPKTLTRNQEHLPADIDIEPGHDGAILTLADGSQVVLDSLGNGVVATQNGAEVVLRNGQLAYDPTGKTGWEISYNTITTPKGRQFSVVLPDGTRVWLNAASSLKYPTIFAGTERKVEVTGEAYFEVVRNTKKPFKVLINSQAQVEVLGTQFNVNAYAGENTINTTLLKGSVKVVFSADSLANNESSAGSKLPMYADRPAVTLQPGQQAQLPVGHKTQQGITIIHNADTEKIMAWKNGLFNFDGSSLTEVMKQLERWYDIEVVYKKGVRDIELEGKMTRDVSLRGLLRILGNLGVQTQLEDRRLTLLP